MTEAATTAAVCVATGAVAAPFCAAFGFDPALLVGGLVGGFMGCVIAQTLIPPKEDVRFRRMVALLVGSVLMATLCTLVIAPVVTRRFSLEELPPGAVRLVIGAIIGAFAQPIAVIGQRKFLQWVERLGKEKGNA